MYPVIARRAKPVRRTLPSNRCVQHNGSKNPQVDALYTLDGSIIPDLYSDEYEFDSNEYQRLHALYRFNFDAAASPLNHKCKEYASKDRSFLTFSAKDLRNKSIWMFPPIESANDLIQNSNQSVPYRLISFL